VGRLVDGRYQVRSRIARGGMATVYLATDTRLERPVALKVMHPHLADDATFVERFTREARSAARLSHPGVVAVFDQGAEGGAVYLAMEHVPGRTLRDVVAARGALPLREALGMAEAVLDALAVAHAAGLVHRDVKPENVLVGDDGRLRVADFGLARAASTTTGTAASTLIGTVGYLAPELVLHGTADARADVYAAGVVLFELLTGRAPFTGGVPAQIAFRHVQEDVPAPSSLRQDVPEDVDDLVRWATARDPERRPADAAELLTGLREVRGSLSDAELDHPAVLVDGASDGQTRRVSREHVLALAVGDELEAEVEELTRTRALQRVPAGATPAAPSAPGRAVSAPASPARRRRAAVAALVAALVLALAAAGTWAVLDGPLARVEVPQVLGVPQAEAEAALAARELDPTVREAYSDDVEAGRVVAASPRVGASVREDSAVTLTVSLGPQLFAVPAVTGATRAEAEAALAAASLAVGAVTEAHSEDVEAGRVVSQGTAAQEQVRGGTPVDLVVSLGRQPIPVPAVAGQPRERAERAVRDAGLVVGGVTAEASESVPEGSVVRSSPAGPLFRGEAVALVVSSGPPVVDVPRVVGQQLAPAQQALEAAGLVVRVERVLGGFFGTVRSQDPAGGQARKGSTVTLVIV